LKLAEFPQVFLDNSFSNLLWRQTLGQDGSLVPTLHFGNFRLISALEMQL
jgi:hypothetical protein